MLAGRQDQGRSREAGDMGRHVHNKQAYLYNMEYNEMRCDHCDRATLITDLMVLGVGIICPDCISI